MCHGHPYQHSCGHSSVTWHYCPSATIDLTTGYQTPCSNMTFASAQQSNASCPLPNCDFSNAGGSWTCCKCGGRNHTGWCCNLTPTPTWERNAITNEWEWITTCDHGCCKNCPREASASGGDGKKSKSSRKQSSKSQREANQTPLTEDGEPAYKKMALDYGGGGPHKERGSKDKNSASKEKGSSQKRDHKSRRK